MEQKIMEARNIKLRPILFSTKMVQAILEGRKTMTRRILNPMPGRQSQWLTKSLLDSASIEGMGRSHEADGYGDFGVQLGHPKGGPLGWIKCPYGKVGDVLWIRESFCKTPDFGYVYTASQTPTGEEYRHEFLKAGEKWAKWKPSIHMPYDACRLFLQITDIKVERLQDISEEDAQREGIYWQKHLSWTVDGLTGNTESAVSEFSHLWECINGPGSWEANPFVWAVSFSRIDKPE